MIKIHKALYPSQDEWYMVMFGMRNPLNSWNKMDTPPCNVILPNDDSTDVKGTAKVGPNDLKLASTLANTGESHSKFRRMLPVYIDISAPIYWWKEFDTYKIGTVRNSSSTMHTIMNKPFTPEDFSQDHTGADISNFYNQYISDICKKLNEVRDAYFKERSLAFKTHSVNGMMVIGNAGSIGHMIKMNNYWRQIIQMLPSSYNQRSMIFLNYEVLARIYRDRRGHKLDEWRTFCEFIENVPYSKLLIVGKDSDICDEKANEHSGDQQDTT